MKAAVVNKFGGGFDIEEVDIDKPIGREVLIDVKASGLCHSDLHFAKADFGMQPPMVLGHEVSGVVLEVGPEVSEFKKGDHVVGSLIQFCGSCVECLKGWTVRCLNPSYTIRSEGESSRLTRDGKPILAALGTAGFAEKSLIHENQLVKIDKDIPFPEACILGCGVITGAGAAVNAAGVRVGDTVAVIGLGGVGLNVVSGARLAGASRVIGIDLNDEKLELAKKFGATDTINAGKGDVVAAIHKLLGGGVNHSFEVIGRKETAEQAVAMLKVGGSANLVGIHKPGGTIELDVNSLLLGQTTVRGIMMGSANIKKDIPMFATMFQQGRFNLSDLISNEIELKDINKAYEELLSGKTARSVITKF